ncbi:ribonuclease P protein component 1 [Halomarina pelagica]|uniref:ribonuclease P protein component 1 n=1 Tax=Halomarina pelagica TaxID=2961599 RepID=UPI0020C2FFFB|nr:ribonuclease P protein component 1 [Halomarina sp. BND7]
MLTAETLPRHELIGLRVRVVESTDPTLVGVEGEVVMETTNTLTVAGARTVQVPKAVATFEFELDGAKRRSADHSSGDEPRDDPEYVVVEGERLVARPARRTERTRGSQWQ